MHASHVINIVEETFKNKFLKKLK